MTIISGDLRPQEKLPSVREMALRLDVHANTVSAACVWLEMRNWVESRKGSGVFVKEKPKRATRNAALNSEGELDAIILYFLQTARTRGFAPLQIAERIKVQLAETSISEILLIENDKELRQILAFEIQSITDLPVCAVNLDEFVEKSGALIVALEETAKIIVTDLPTITLRFNSVHDQMRGNERPLPKDLIGIASR